jgi:NTP pyrophosphatase (non-canonical NTP hydrolase)
MELKEFQQEVLEWSKKNFGEDEDPFLRVFGMVEEVGELCHAVLKSKQSIRHVDDQRARDLIEDALGDIMVYMADLAGRLDIDFDLAVFKTWNEVKLRDWTLYPGDGRTH